MDMIKIVSDNDDDSYGIGDCDDDTRIFYNNPCIQTIWGNDDCKEDGHDDMIEIMIVVIMMMVILMVMMMMINYHTLAS